MDWVRLELDVGRFDIDRFADRVSNVRASGVRLATLDELGDTDTTRHALYELNKHCAADIPDRGGFYSWDDYRRQRLDVPSFAAAGVVIALDGNEWIGMTASRDHRADGFVFNEMTGVVATHRRQGIALALKVTGVGFVRSCGVIVARTVHHPRNIAMIRLNRELGYTDAAWPYPSGATGDSATSR